MDRKLIAKVFEAARELRASVYYSSATGSGAWRLAREPEDVPAVASALAVELGDENGDLIQAANHRALLQAAREDNEPWAIVWPDDTSGVVLLDGQDNCEALQVLSDLQSYPLIDDEALSSLELDLALDCIRWDAVEAMGAVVRALTGGAVDVDDVDLEGEEPTLWGILSRSGVELEVWGPPLNAALIGLDDLELDGETAVEALDLLADLLDAGRVELVPGSALDDPAVTPRFEAEAARPSLFGGWIPPVIVAGLQRWQVEPTDRRLDTLDRLAAAVA